MNTAILLFIFIVMFVLTFMLGILLGAKMTVDKVVEVLCNALEDSDLTDEQKMRLIEEMKVKNKKY